MADWTQSGLWKMGQNDPIEAWYKRHVICQRGRDSMPTWISDWDMRNYTFFL